MENTLLNKITKELGNITDDIMRGKVDRLISIARESETDLFKLRDVEIEESDIMKQIYVSLWRYIKKGLPGEKVVFAYNLETQEVDTTGLNESALKYINKIINIMPENGYVYKDPNIMRNGH